MEVVWTSGASVSGTSSSDMAGEFFGSGPIELKLRFDFVDITSRTGSHIIMDN